MFDVTAKIAELIAMGIEPTAAANVAGQMLAQEQSLQAALMAEKTRVESAMGLKDWHGIKVSGMKGDRPSEKYSKAVTSGFAIEPANRGIDSKTGKPVLWPPMAWIAVAGRSMLNLTQAQSVTVLKAFEAMGAENFHKALQAIGSDDAVKAYNVAKAELVNSGEIVGRKTA